MSPIADPRWARARREADEAMAREASELSRWEYLRPAAMLAVGMTGTMIWMVADPAARSSPNIGTLQVVVGYPIVVAFQVLFGIAGLWIASSLWLGGAGPLTLGVLRLAGIYTLTDLLDLLVAPLLLLGTLFSLAVYVGLLAWLFELDWREAIVVGLITFLLKTGVYLAILVVAVGVT